MLVWLASAVPAVRSALVELGLGVRVDPSEVTPSTQYGISGGRLDALLEGEGFRLAVESKLGSDYGPDQIGKYLRWLAVRKSSVANSGLMTLTARPAPWAQEDVDYARVRSSSSLDASGKTSIRSWSRSLTTITTNPCLRGWCRSS